MTAQRMVDAAARVADRVESVNEVRLVGRLAVDPETKDLPSGVTLVQLRVVVERPRGGDARQRSDTVECAVWTTPMRKRVAKWHAGDTVEVTGAIHRRFFRSGGATVARVEVEMGGGKVIRRAGSG